MSHSRYFLAVVTTIGLLCALNATAAGKTQVSLAQGLLEGSRDNGIASFKGIPYAQPPVGDRRWLPPSPVEPHLGTRAAMEFGANCPQTERAGLNEPDATMSEDCLTLNVWSPKLDNAKRPVMVWIHGGGFRFGSGDIQGELIASEDIVLVSINYRLGPLGFFAHEALPGVPANPGLLDIEESLRWVQENIEAFGGDPKNVTVFGVSAGGMAVNLLMTSNRTENLFARAIAQSGYAAWALPRSQAAPAPAPMGVGMTKAESAESISSALVASVTDEAQSREALYALDGMALTNALRGFQVPIVDGNSVLEEPAILFLRGQQHAVPYITGGNSFEGSVMAYSGISEESYRATLGSDLSAARKAYATDSDELWLPRMFGDNRYLISARLLAGAMKKVEAPAWLYYIDFVPDAKKAEQPGTAHGQDGYYLWAGMQMPDPQVNTFAKAMRSYWFNFARSGNPNSKPLPTWPRYDAQSDEWLVLKNPPGAETAVIKQRLDLIERRYRQRVQSALSQEG
ncbi:MAG: carboxylesterase family protein [Halioglobus sp.]